MKRSRIIGVALVISGAATWAATSEWLTQPKPETPIPLSVDENSLFHVVTKTSQSGQQHISHDYIGRIEPQDSIPIVARLEGVIEKVFVEPGDIVEPGQLLFQIRSDTLSSRLRQAETSLDEAQSHLQSVKALHAKSYASDAELRSATSAYEAARSNRETVLEDVGHAKVRAPAKGRMPLDIPSKGDYVDAKKALFTMTSHGDFKVALKAPPSKARLIQDSSIKVAVGGEVFDATVIAIDVAAEEASITLDIAIHGSSQRTAGEIARVSVTETVENAHLVDGNLVEISASGSPVIKVVEQGAVKSLTMDSVRFSDSSLIATGLPAEIELITRGGGFVTDGESVRTSRGAE